MSINLCSAHAIEINRITELCLTDIRILSGRTSLKSMRLLLCNLPSKNSQGQTLLLVPLNVKSVKIS